MHFLGYYTYILEVNKFLCQSQKWKIYTHLTTYYTLICKHTVLLTTIRMHEVVTRIWMLQGLCWFQEVFNHQRECFEGVSGEIFPKLVPNFNICAPSLSYLVFTQFRKKFFFSRAFHAPMKSKIKFRFFQGLQRVARTLVLISGIEEITVLADPKASFRAGKRY